MLNEPLYLLKNHYFHVYTYSDIAECYKVKTQYWHLVLVLFFNDSFPHIHVFYMNFYWWEHLSVDVVSRPLHYYRCHHLFRYEYMYFITSNSILFHFSQEQSSPNQNYSSEDW